MDTKEYIIDEAFKLFLTHSYEGVSISQLSKAIGMTKGALYHHFESKNALFQIVVDKYLKFTPVEVDVDSISLYDYLLLSVEHAEKIIRSLFKYSNTFTPFDYMSFISDAFRHYPDYAEVKANYINDEIEKSVMVITNAIKSGEIRSDINVSIVASNFFALGIGLAGNLVLNCPLEETISRLREQNMEFYKLLKKA